MTRKYGLMQREYRKGAEEYHRGGIEVPKTKIGRTKWRSGAPRSRRRQAKIGQLVMDERSDVERVGSPRLKDLAQESVDF